MERFTVLTDVAAPLMRDNIDTDTIIPIHRQVGTNIRGTLGRWCFSNLRYQADGSEEPGFVFNQAPFRSASIVLAGRNFGCGSSREGAVWAMQEMGLACVVAPSFGDIFFNNCFQNGLLPVVLEEQAIAALARQAPAPVTVSLEACTVTAPSGECWTFAIEKRRRTALLQGLDEIGTTLTRADRIARFQAADARRRPWIHIFGDAA